jgi:hypothetical protein
MTSSVKFHAHCGATKELIVVVSDKEPRGGDEEWFTLDKYVLNDGDQVEIQIYGERTVLSYEQNKEK